VLVSSQRKVKDEVREVFGLRKWYKIQRNTKTYAL